MRRFLWLAVLLAVAGCSSGGGEAGDDGAGDAGPDAADVEPDAAEEADDAPEEESGPPPLDLALGEVLELTAGEDGSFTASLATPTPARQYGLVLYSARWASGTVSYELSVTGAAASRLEGATKELPGPPARRPRDWLELIPSLARELREGTSHIARDPMPPPTVGERRTFQIQGDAGPAHTVEGECLAVGADLALWMDRTTGGTTDPSAALLSGVLAGSEEILMPRERQYFGEETDINTDGLINVLWSPVVGEIGASAFFFPCDLFDSTDMPLGCTVSNEQELVYSMPPEGFMADRPEAVLGTIAHEIQHLIYFGRKVILGGASGGENAYVLEGWAELGADVTGYGYGTFFQLGDTLDYSDDWGMWEILHSGGGYDTTGRSGMLYGAAYIWTRYVFDRMGGDSIATDESIVDEGGIAWAYGAVNSAREGRQNFEFSTGLDMDDLVFDFYTALFLTGRTDAAGAPLPLEPRYTYLPQATDPLTTEPRGFDPYADFFGFMRLNGPHTVTPATADGTMRTTGNEMVVLDWDGTSPAMSVSVRGDEASSLRARLVRLR
ncbi:MAG: hypothetical protein HY905_22160 [Deltaproteobacteria bacterium]|nr:hypothetical protein [Deltaproteobacteria bacterium]